MTQGMDRTTVVGVTGAIGTAVLDYANEVVALLVGLTVLGYTIHKWILMARQNPLPKKK